MIYYNTPNIMSKPIRKTFLKSLEKGKTQFPRARPISVTHPAQRELAHHTAHAGKPTGALANSQKSPRTSAKSRDDYTPYSRSQQLYTKAHTQTRLRI
jgi:hypothetical protein